jgi:hypothetical protein
MGSCVKPTQDVAVGNKVVVVTSNSYINGINIDSGLPKSTVAITLNEDGHLLWKKEYDLNSKVF